MHKPRHAGPSRRSSAKQPHGPSLLSRLHTSAPAQASKSQKKRRQARHAPTIEGPLFDEQYIESEYHITQIDPSWVVNPKSFLANQLFNQYSPKPRYEPTQVNGPDGTPIWRTTLVLPYEQGEIVAIGDAKSKSESERLCSISAIYQAHAADLIDVFEFSPQERTLSDGSKVDYERARHFMDYYCRRFGFGKPELTYASIEKEKTYWSAEMAVGGRRIGMARGQSKKLAMTACFVDVTHYLDECDPEVWKQFLLDMKTGKDLGMAPKVTFQIEPSIADEIQDVGEDIRRSNLYLNRPKSISAENSIDTTSQPLRPRYTRPPASPATLAEKSEALKQRRERYFTDPALEKIRNTRAGLPVFTKAEELLQHVKEHDVTICMAATGSGKTTQIPQLLLDEWIEKGEGAKCNIVCTQPRRIAAISVANRVAQERGEKSGRGSTVGYQVRFESNLPDEHGSITFCTTGIFLKRMQSALQGESIGRSLDDVTHIVVDEVHERDVDTDLLLVVLKRLLADRKARGKPIKVILMSATIDPTLFQQYFKDDAGKPADVIEIPGRAFPVDKNFLDDFVPALAKDKSSEWVFLDNNVQKYLAHELGQDAVQVPGMRNRRAPAEQPNEARDEDLDLPTPLVALTIAHVLRRTDEGHVLVFLPGWEDIVSVQKALLDPRPLLGVDFNDNSRYSIHLLHSTIPVAEQQVVFEPPPPGIRRIILATNIAETSVTIPDVVYVVDTARVKEQRYDPERHISSLVSAWVGSSNLNQRAGRAGRHRPGEYYGILSRQHAEKLQPHQTVEMKRVDLSNVVMHVKALNFPGMSVEEVLAAAIEPPGPDRVEAAMKSLQMVGALDERKNLTSLGRVLLQLPVDVQLGRLVLYGSFFRCLDQALTLAAILSNRDPFLAPPHLKAEAQAKKNSWTPEEFRSDVLATLRAYNAWWELQGQGHYVAANRFCSENFLSKPTLLLIDKIKKHLLQSLYQVGAIDVSAGGAVAGIPSGPRAGREIVPAQLNENGNSYALLAALIAIASQPKYAIRTTERAYRTAQEKIVVMHPSSVNSSARRTDRGEQDPFVDFKQIVAYAEKRRNLSSSASSPTTYLVTTTRLDPLTYILFGAYRIEVTGQGLECDGWLPIVGNSDVLDDIERLKGFMEGSMLRVFEGIIAGKSSQRLPPPRDMDREHESEDEDEDMRNRPLTTAEIRELDSMTRDIVRVLDRYSRYRVISRSRQNSRPGTPRGPYDRSSLASAAQFSHFSRSGYNTPYGSSSAYNSRPATPSHLNRERGVGSG
ncbi:P-loop containing nucleoside triphosphate hydrolase protein [Obba rivulosa]|uniref:P-loop containing nucleoside triphosphate hydrolase protein n=1 Tax=Obba rivulosa TaxID=1052685 RepID=A0A8E2J728_9APHY|nr:P-loop containing nucleoside triphosphate hydrolase protein [Obba rivulosa]